MGISIAASLCQLRMVGLKERTLRYKSYIYCVVSAGGILAANLVLAMLLYETIGWHDVRGYREVTHGMVHLPIWFFSFINLIVGLVVARIILRQSPTKPPASSRQVSPFPAISASFLASAALLPLSLLIVPVVGPVLNHSHLLSTPLDQAAAYQDDLLVISKVLAGENPNVKAPVTGATPLHCMVGGRKLAAVKVLLQNGAKTNVADSRGRTPLHWAVEGRAEPEIVQLLLDAGALPLAKDHEGKTPIDCTESVPSPEGPAIRSALQKAAKMPIQDPVGDSPKVAIPGRN